MESIKYATRNAIAAATPPRDAPLKCQFCDATNGIAIHDSLSGEKYNTFIRSMLSEAKKRGHAAPRKFSGTYAKTTFAAEDADFATAAIAHYRATIRVFIVCTKTKCIRDMNEMDARP